MNSTEDEKLSKAAYQSPQIVDYGDARQITEASPGTSGTDGGGTIPNVYNS